MVRPAPLVVHRTEFSDDADPAAAARAWAEMNGRWIAGLVEMNALAWTSWLDAQRTFWQQAQAGVEQLPLWANWQFGTEQLA